MTRHLHFEEGGVESIEEFLGDIIDRSFETQPSFGVVYAVEGLTRRLLIEALLRSSRIRSNRSERIASAG